MYKVELIHTKTGHKGLSSPELALEEKTEGRSFDNLLHLTYVPGLYICDYLCGRSWACWIENLL